MDKKSFIRGFGTGVLFVAVILGIAINLRYIWRIEKDKLYMAEECRSFEKTVPVSRRMYKQVNQKFIDYNRKQED